jgi:hypothetical protein
MSDFAFRVSPEPGRPRILLATARANLAVAVGPSGLIFAIGGNTSLLGPTASVEALSV